MPQKPIFKRFNATRWGRDQYLFTIHKERKIGKILKAVLHSKWLELLFHSSYILTSLKSVVRGRWVL